MGKAIIFLNGDLSAVRGFKKIAAPGNLIICADGGYKLARKLGVTPHVVIGDFDSISQNLAEEIEREDDIEVLRFPKDKDQTDAELAFKLAQKRGYKQIVVCGFFGRRLDHLIANISVAAYLAKQGIECTFIDSSMQMNIVTKKHSIRGSKGDRVSLIPLKGDIKVIRTKGLRYALKKDTLLFGKTRGISNKLVKPEAHIAIKGGTLLVIHTMQKTAWHPF